MPRIGEKRSQGIERKFTFVMNKDRRSSNSGLLQSSQSSLLPFQRRRAHSVLRECLRFRNMSYSVARQEGECSRGRRACRCVVEWDRECSRNWSEIVCQRRAPVVNVDKQEGQVGGS